MPVTSNSQTTVIVIRSHAQARALMPLLHQKGFSVLCCPTVDIVPVTPKNELLTQIAATFFDAVIFTSTNAVTQAFNWLAMHQTSLQAAHWLAIGPTTQALLNRFTDKIVSTGETSNSTGLLAHLSLSQPLGQSILIFTGEEGLDLLEPSLTSRGAQVTVVNVYRRAQVKTLDNLSQLNDLLDTSPVSRHNVIFASSVTSLTHLIQKIDSSRHSHLFQLPVIAASPRIAEAAKQLGFLTILTASDANNEAMVNRLEHYLLNSL